MLEVCGGCNAKIGAGDLEGLLAPLPVVRREDVVLGFEKKEDGAVIRTGPDEGMIVTMDFFPTMVEDPYLFGKIAAANALSDIYAMGGTPVSAMNMVCFPEEEDLDLLREILRGGAEVVAEAGATLCGGHSIHDPKIKYGLSVTGKVQLSKLWQNHTAEAGDLLLLTKPLGISLLMNGFGVGEVSREDYERGVESMVTLNKGAAEILKNYDPHAVTDVTGFALMGHLTEMTDAHKTAVVFTDSLPVFPGAKEAAEEFVMTAGGQRNRQFLKDKVSFQFDDYAMEEVLFDPQTSGGLLAALPREKAFAALEDCKKAGLHAAVIGKIGPWLGVPVIVKGGHYED